MTINNKLTLEERLSRLERIVSERRKMTNEAIPDALAKVAPILSKNLPAFLEVLPKEIPLMIKALESDTMNDNKEKIEALTQLNEIGKKLSEMFK